MRGLASEMYCEPEFFGISCEIHLVIVTNLKIKSDGASVLDRI